MIGINNPSPVHRARKFAARAIASPGGLEKSVLAVFAALVLLAACSTAETEPTATPAPTAIPVPTFDASRLGTAEKDVTYCTPDDLPQYMDIYFPESGGPWPVLLYVHGGSWFEGDKAEGEGWRGMNANGYLVAAVNYRMAAEGKFPVMVEQSQILHERLVEAGVTSSLIIVEDGDHGLQGPNASPNQEAISAAINAFFETNLK